MNAITRKISILVGMLMVAAFPVMSQDAIAIGEKVLPIAEQQTSDHIVFPAIRNVPGKIPILKTRIFFNSPVAAGRTIALPSFSMASSLHVTPLMAMNGCLDAENTWFPPLNSERGGTTSMACW